MVRDLRMPMWIIVLGQWVGILADRRAPLRHRLAMLCLAVASWALPAGHPASDSIYRAGAELDAKGYRH